MTARELVWSWVWAAILLIGLIIALGRIAPADPHPAKADVYVIGTSLMAYAFPVIGWGQASPFGSYLVHRNLATSGLQEHEALDRLEAVLLHRPSTVVVEANMFLFDFASAAHQRPCDAWSLHVRHVAGQWRLALTDGFRRLAGWPGRLYIADPANLDAAQSIRATDLDRVYPLALRQPCETHHLQQLVARARQQGTRVVMVLPPRAPVAQARLGSATNDILPAHAKELAMRAGAELFVPDAKFTDEHFVDHAHLNRTGRALWLADFKRWWSAGP